MRLMLSRRKSLPNLKTVLWECAENRPVKNVTFFYRQALDFMIDTMKDKLSVAVDVDSNEEVLKILRSCVNSNEKWGSFLADFAVKAVKQVWPPTQFFSVSFFVKDS